MDKILDLTVIVPITRLEDKDRVFLKTAIESVVVQSVSPIEVVYILSETLDINDFKKSVSNVTDLDYKFKQRVIQINSNNFCDLVNKGVTDITTKFFSILELNSEYTPTYFKMVDQYINSKEYNKMSAFLPTTALITDKGYMLQFANESVWAQGFAETMGQLDSATLLNYDSFVLGGAVINKEAFEEVGGFKHNIKMYHVYEFLLRFVHNDFNVVVIPKLGYKHLVDENGTLYNTYRDATIGITPEEKKFFLDTAKKEYLFNPNEIEREIIYSPAVGA